MQMTIFLKIGMDELVKRKRIKNYTLKEMEKIVHEVRGISG